LSYPVPPLKMASPTNGMYLSASTINFFGGDDVISFGGTIKLHGMWALNGFIDAWRWDVHVGFRLCTEWCSVTRKYVPIF